MKVSVLILTLNEEENLPGCLGSVIWSDDIVVFDSYSTDQTVEIAHSHGALVIQKHFNGYASQRNAALAVDFKHSWILMVDADEQVTPELRREIELLPDGQDNDYDLFRVRRKDFFMGRWLKRSSAYPTWFARLLRKGAVHVEREINEEYIARGKTGCLKEHLYHYPFNKGVSFWFERHNLYSSMEAMKLIEETTMRFPWRCILSKDPVIRRKVLKQLAYRLPGRPLLVFCYLYFIRLGLLDGGAGITYCVMRSVYEFMINLKVLELRRQSQGNDV